MSKALKSLLIKSGIALVAGLILSAIYISGRDFSELELVGQYRVLCDGFTVPGLMMVLVGLLFWLGNLGAFYAFGYLFRYVIKAFAPGAIKIGRYLDYVEEQREKQLKGFGFLFVAGGILMTVAIVFLALFYGVYVE